MNKKDLIEEVAEVLESKAQASELIDSVLANISKALKKKDTVPLTGFGTFKIVERKARKGRNPRTGEEIDIKKKSVPKFVPSKTLLE